jgi:hypothetical protein
VKTNGNSFVFTINTQVIIAMIQLKTKVAIAIRNSQRTHQVKTLMGQQRDEAINQTSNFPNILISNQIANKTRKKRVRFRESRYNRRM